ncbi:hypothetical protein BBP40_003327 [Aspergillus hancockii]|nr:hypothetical protein BBP40_003327 [Aspergillus hancockii]
MQSLLFLEYALARRAWVWETLSGQRSRFGPSQSSPLDIHCRWFAPSCGMRARSMALVETPSYLLRWSEDGQTVYYNNQAFTMDRSHRLVDHLFSMVEEQWQELMFDTLPPVGTSRVVDDLPNRRPGLSFIKTPLESSLGGIPLTLPLCLHRPTESAGQERRVALAGDV